MSDERSIPRESDELQPIVVKLDKVEVIANVKYQITSRGARPTGTWINAEVVDGKTYFRVDGLTPGRYTVHGQVLADPTQIISRPAGNIRIV